MEMDMAMAMEQGFGVGGWRGGDGMGKEFSGWLEGWEGAVGACRRHNVEIWQQAFPMSEGWY
jgi:hypothetical protein